jgi:hypothetical protein
LYLSKVIDTPLVLLEVLIPLGFHSQRAKAFTAFPNFTLFLFTDPAVVTFDLAVATVGLAILVFGTHFWL